MGPEKKAQFQPPKDDMAKLKKEIENAISHMPDFEKLKSQIELKLTPEGLRIEMKFLSGTGTRGLAGI
jgi:hypothetical protein